MIKLLLILVIFIMCFCVGYVINSYLKNRILIYEDLCRMCNDFRSEIYFLQTDYKTMLTRGNYAKQTSQLISCFLKNGQTNSMLLKPKENGEIKEFLLSIGKRDVDGEIKNLVYWENVFQIKQTQVRQFYEKYGTLILKLAIIVGAMLAIILL